MFVGWVSRPPGKTERDPSGATIVVDPSMVVAWRDTPRATVERTAANHPPYRRSAENPIGTPWKSLSVRNRSVIKNRVPSAATRSSRTVNSSRRLR